jgi:hyaluronan synthase
MYIIFIGWFLLLNGIFFYPLLIPTVWWTHFLYGFYLMLYFTTEVVCSYLNHRTNLAIEKTPVQDTALLIVGYREDPWYWKRCLESLKDLKEYPYITRVLVVIDGDTEEDRYMIETYHDLFGYFKSGIRCDPIPHGGKRSALHYGIRELCRDDRIRFIMTSDSDTLFQDGCVESLYHVLTNDPQNGCVTGILDIFNKCNILTRVVNARYLYAFHIERGMASYFGVMSCCSGPISMYRKEVLSKEVIEEFRTQTCFGVPVEPGDDRHLTNLTLMQGYRSRQVSLARASTESPTSLYRFCLQQLRWSRSYYRELYYLMRSIPRQHWMLSVITNHDVLFSFHIVFWIVFIFWKKYHVITSFCIALGILFMRILVLMTRIRELPMVKWYDLLFLLYYFPLYFTIMLPIRMYAMITCNNMGWITSDRKNRNNTAQCGLVLFIVLWDAYLLYHIFFVVIDSIARTGLWQGWHDRP